MKIHLFYLHLPVIDPKIYPGVVPDEIYHAENEDLALYAWTEDKSIGKKFKQTHDMEIFSYVERSISKSEFASYLHDERVGSHYLENRYMKTETIKDNRFTVLPVSVLTTKVEIEYISQNIDELFMRKLLCDSSSIRYLIDNDITADIFKKKYAKVLNEVFLFDTILGKERQQERSSPPWENITFSEGVIDTLDMYCKVFYNVYNIGGFDKCEFTDSTKNLKRTLKKIESQFSMQ